MNRSFAGAGIVLDPPESLGQTVGLLALATDANVEGDLRQQLPSGIRLCTSRIPNADPITAESLRDTAEAVTTAADTILPDRAVDALVYGCTAGAALLGGAVERALRASRPSAHCLTPLSSAVAAMRHLDISRVSILSPNLSEINQRIAEHVVQAGFVVTGVTGLDICRDEDITRVRPDELERVARESCEPEADGLLISCTSLRTTSVVESIERALCRPVVTSNQALAWDLTRRVGLGRLAGGTAAYGRLSRTVAVPGRTTRRLTRADETTTT